MNVSGAEYQPLLRRPFHKLLVANRGEIAVRVLRGAREAGLATVAVFSDADAASTHVAAADQAVRLGPAEATLSYLRIDAIIDAARQTGAEAVHPGYGFLAENPDFADACEAAGLVLVGPPASAIRAMGDKARARQLAIAAGLPVIPGYDGDGQDLATLESEAARIGFPLLIKPSAGGGGKGMKRVDGPAQFAESLHSARREARNAFADDRLILERYLDPIRHVEIQVFADGHGQTVSLFERECSVQRRHQKILEEAPSTAVSPEVRARMGVAATSLARAVDYRGAGTVEFVVDAAGEFYFLEMNTRLQVEHPVTELITGLDLVHLQLREAMGEALPEAALHPSIRGHAIECRLYAEDPAHEFLPSTGRISVLQEPRGPGVRLDSGIETGSEIGVHYDPILAKLVVYAETRDQARARLQRALAETVILGVRTNLGFLRAVAAHPAFAAGETYTNFVARHFPEWSGPAEPAPVDLAFAALAALDTPGGSRANPGGGTRSGREAGDGNGDPGSPWGRLAGFRLSEEVS